MGENDSQPRMAPNLQELGMKTDHKGGKRQSPAEFVVLDIPFVRRFLAKPREFQIWPVVRMKQ